MKNPTIILTLIFSFLKTSVWAQTSPNYISPQFKGGRGAFYSYLTKNINYPAADREAGMEPNLTATIYISKDGKIKFVNVIGGRPELKTQVKRALTLMPDWSGGKWDDVPIDTCVIQKIYLSMGKSRINNDSTICEILEYKVVMGVKESAEFLKSVEKSSEKQKEAERLYDKALVASNNNNLQEAIGLFNQAKQKGLRGVNLYYNLGVVHLKVGNKDSACTYFNEAAKMGDDDAFKTYLKFCK